LRVQGSEFDIWSKRIRAQGLGFRLFEFRVKSLGLRVQGVGLKV
jgi:hypothetical protein